MATEPDDATFQQLVLSQAAARETLEKQIRAAASTATRGFRGWYDSDAISEWAAKLVRTLNPRYRALARLTDAYLARSATLVVGKRVQPVGAVEMAALRAAVTPAGAYARAADVYRWQQSRLDAFGRDLAGGVDVAGPPDLQDPIDAAIRRILDVAGMDAQLVQRNQSQAFYTAHKDVITGWRRVIHPELSAGGTCGLCIVISDRLYGPTEPLEVHENCKCTTVAVRDGRDPGSKLNATDLKALYRDAGSTSADKLKRTRYQVNEHGELGRVLTDRADNFRDRHDVAKDENKTRDKRTPAEARASAQRVYTCLQAALPRARDLAEQDPDKWGRYLAALEARLDDLETQIGP